MSIVLYYLLPFLCGLVGCFFGCLLGAALITRYLKASFNNRVVHNAKKNS